MQKATISRKTAFKQKNKLTKTGENTCSTKTATTKLLSKGLFRANYFETVISVPRLSGECDNLRLNLPEHIRAGKEIGDEIAILGQFRSRNVMEGTKSKLELIVFALSELDPESVDERSTNIVMLSGFICKPTTMRVTPFGREIADLLVAVNRGHKKSDYLPALRGARTQECHLSLWLGMQSTLSAEFKAGNIKKRILTGV